jgi:hypothetical protein
MSAHTIFQKIELWLQILDLIERILDLAEKLMLFM